MIFGISPSTILARMRKFGGRPDATRSLIANKAGVNQTFDWTFEERRELYNEWESLYANSIYMKQRYGGFRERIFQRSFDKANNSKLPLHGWYNPAKSIVDCYQHCIRGQFGVDFDVAKKVGLESRARDVNELILEPLEKIWQWSNLNDRMSPAQYMAANFGCVGFRIDAELTDRSGAAIPEDRQKVRVVPVRPHDIRDVILDDQKNVIAVELEYVVNDRPLGSLKDNFVTYRQQLDTDSFKVFKEDKKVSETPNELGVCPFVLLAHEDIEHPYGVPAHFGTIEILHQINWLFSRIGISVDRHVFAKWFAAAGGPAPEIIDMDGTTMAYVQTNPGDTQPKLEAIVAKLDYNGIWNVLVGLRAHIRERQPELVLASLEALSGQSGETITKLLSNTEQKILAARGRYEHAVVRTNQMAISWGVVKKLWDVGTGTGGADAANRAYLEGKLDFNYNVRPALPPTVFDRIKMAEADNADARLKAQIAKDVAVVAGDEEAMKRLGMSKAEIEAALKSKADNAAPPNTGGGPGGGGM